MPSVAPLPIHVPDVDPADGLCAMLEPLLGRSRGEAPGAFAHYHAAARDLFEPTDRKRAAVAVLPWNWEFATSDPTRRRRARSMIRDHAAAGLRTLIFHTHDSETPLRLRHTVVFRTSLVRGRHGRHEHAMPWLSAGFPELGLQPAAQRPYQRVPSVAFCGTLHREHYRTPTLYRRLFRRHRNQYPIAYPHPPGLRAIALDVLKATPGLDCRFIERDRFLGGAVRADGSIDPQVQAQTRADFVNNLLDADYALCVRGAGNFSIRFAEILAAGRIPLFIDSACVLPWPGRVDWREVLVSVDLGDLPRLGETLLREHRQSDPVEFAARQRRCREVWDQLISPLGFFSTLRDELAAGAL